MSVQVTPLRQRMIDDMAIRNMSPLTQKAYVRAVKNFSLYFRRSPDRLTWLHRNVHQLWPRGLSRRSRHVLRDSGLSDLEAELQKLSMDARCAPEGVLKAHLYD